MFRKYPAFRSRLDRMSAALRRSTETSDIVTVLLVVLVGLSAFGIGRLSAEHASKEPIRVDFFDQVEHGGTIPGSLTAAASAAAAIANAANPDAVVASKNSTKYHYPWCPGAKQISDANKITFNSAAEAQAAGYEPAANCKGLK